MKTITYIRIHDFGVENIANFEAWFPLSKTHHTDHFEYGEGTDAESALDDLLHKLSEHGFDIGHVEVKYRREKMHGSFSGGLENLIKILWLPTEDEGDGETTKYYLGIHFNSVEQ